MLRKLFGTLCLLIVTAPVSAQPGLVPVPGHPEMLLGPVQAPQVVRDGRMKIETTKLDLGKPSDIFDGKPETVIRTPSINPAFVEFVLDEPVSFHGLRIITNEQAHQYTLVAANSLEDLKAKRGSYKILGKGTTGHDGEVVFASATPVSYRAFRVDLKRVEGDDYVHVGEWEFLEPVKLKDMKVEYKIRCSHAGEPAVYEPLNDQSRRPEDSILSFKVTATEENGQTFDATDIAKVQFRGKYARKWRGGPAVELPKPDDVDVSVEVADLTKTGKVKVLPRELKNRQMDLDAQFVERLPRINIDGPNKGQPLEGQQVIWRAHVQNWGEKSVTSAYRWTLDGREIARGTVKIGEGKTVTLDLPWTWEKRRHFISFEIDPDKKIAEFVKHNNKVDFETDALAVGFYIERSFWDYHHEHQYELGLDDANSFADYGQRHMRHWNKMLSAARFPEAPHGIQDRVRLDEVVIVPDQSIPFQPGDYPTNAPNYDDKSVDMIWGFPYKFDHFAKPFDFEKMREGIAKQNLGVHWFFLDLALIHELNHARYLIDTYGLDVHAGGTDPEKANIKIRDDQGRWIVGLYIGKEIVHYDHYEGDMGGPYEGYGVYEAVMLNRIAGQRTHGGNTNGTSNIGEFLQDIPKQFKIKFTGPNGEILANDPVKVYWAEPQDNWYGKVYDNTPDRQFTTDADGCITTDKTFFATDGKIVHTWGHSNAVPIVRIDHQGKTYYIFVEVTEANVLANTSTEPVPTMTEVVPLRTGEPTPISPEYGRRKVPDWHIRTRFDRVD